MTQTHPSLELKDLEDKLDLLISQYQSVKNENNSLKTKQEVLVMEKAKLLQKRATAIKIPESYVVSHTYYLDKEIFIGLDS